MINRRVFGRVLSLATAGVALSGTAATRREPVPAARKLLKPKKLNPGDTVGLVLPASAAFEPDNIQLAKELLEALEFKVVIGAHAFDKFGYFAGTDRDRASDINTMFANPGINGIFCYTGGWGSPRVLPFLDFEMIARNPKVIIGYSDITALLNAIHQRTGLVTFHGPVASSTFEKYSVDNFRRVVMSSEPIGVLENPPKKEDQLVDKTNRILHIVPGKATGRLAGGNLSLLAATMGTPYEIDSEGAILLIEDTHEEPYRIDRMLTQLALGGKFSRVAGVVFGRCTECNVTGPSFSIEEVLRGRFSSLGVPVISGLSFGHIEQKLTLPIGIPATLDAATGTLNIAEASVV